MSAALARRLLERTGAAAGHPIISLYLDLNPEEFATAPARATQVRALLDEARRASGDLGSLSHEDRAALAADLERIEAYLSSDELPVSGARALAVFCSGPEDLFETATLDAPTASRVYVGLDPHVEPLVGQGGDERWCAAMVSSRSGHVYLGQGSQVTARQSIEDYVRGHGQRGAVAANTQEQDIEGHLHALAEAIYHDWQRQPFATLALSGPVQSVSRLQELLHNDLRPILATCPLSLDDAAASDSDVAAAMAAARDARRQAAGGRALRELADTTRAVTGVADTLLALTERRVRALLLSRDFAAAGGRCRSCAMLVVEGVEKCPGDGTAIDPVPDLREAAVQDALLQDADVIAYDQPQDALPAPRPIAALLRF